LQKYWTYAKDTLDNGAPDDEMERHAELRQLFVDIENELMEDKLAHLVFKTIAYENLKRAEACIKYSIPEEEYAKAKKRMNTVIDRIALN